MTSDVPIDPTINDTFRQMSALIYAGADSGSIHQSLVESARQLIEGCDRASLLVRTRDRYVTAASTDDIARRIDQIELEIGEGPCVDAIVSEAYQHDADLTDATTPWPRFTERIVAETPVRSAIGYRLLLDGRQGRCPQPLLRHPRRPDVQVGRRRRRHRLVRLGRPDGDPGA